MEHSKLGPLAGLRGTWEGDQGHDLAIDDKRGEETNVFRERMVFEPLKDVDNHEQFLYGLSYSTKAWRLGVEESFHEEVGYWLWDPARRQVMRCFLVPRGIAVIAGGTVEPTARAFKLAAQLGSPTYGICSNPFLDEEFRTLSFEVDVTIDGDTLTYAEDTVIQMKGRDALFHHTDRNTLRRVR